MADWNPDLDPDLREVLLDVASDPRTTLFRVTPRDVAVGALDDVPSASAGTAGWTAGERELLTAYREHVGELLRVAFAVRLEMDEGAKDLVLNDSLHYDEHKTRADVRRLVRSSRSVSLGESVRTFLRTIAEEEPLRWPSLGELAHASLRLVDNDATRVAQAVDLVVRQRYEEGLAVAHRAAGKGTRRFVRACAWSIIGLAGSLRGKLEDAREGFGRAHRLAPYDVEFAANCYVNALDRGRREEVVVTAKALDELAGSSDRAVERFISMNRARGYSGGTSVLKEWWKVLSLVEGLGPASWAIAHALVVD